MKFKLLLLILGFLLTTNHAYARDRVIKCQINSNYKVVYKGRCMFSPERGGSFTLTNPQRNRTLTRYIDMVNVHIVGRGIADVSGLTTSGNNSRWGEARRSSRDGACWEGSDFMICAW